MLYLEQLTHFIAQAVERSLDIYLKTLHPSINKNKKYFPLAQISTHTPYSPKYLNLLARNGLIDAHKVGKEWVTTQEAIEEYIRNRKKQPRKKSQE